VITRLLVAASLVVGVPAMAQPAKTAEADWIVDSRTGCRMWNPQPNANETITWSGACPGGFANGHGVEQWYVDGKPYERTEGEMRDGRWNGRAVQTMADGSTYDGEWRDGQKTGQGTQLAANGARYDGEWQNSQRHGRGTQTFPSGLRYEGEWQHNRPNGHGKATKGGDTFEGTWREGCFVKGDQWVIIGTTKEECGFK